MSAAQPLVVLVHGAFAESASWNGVLEHLDGLGIDAVAVANPLRSLAGDAAYVRDVVAASSRKVVLVGHSYGGMVISEAGAGDDRVVGLVYVAAFVPEHGQSALELSNSEPGSTLGDALVSYPVASGGNEFAIRLEAFHGQFAADVPAATARSMALTQRPVTEAALTAGLQAEEPAWRRAPSWFVFGDADRNIPVAVHRAGAERASSRGTWELSGASHALGVSQPAAVAAAIAQAVAEVSTTARPAVPGVRAI
ncbi:alpha/beta fold hydrolase [Agromyces seonyuensis]|uniref:Alpha/beta fold hydrolase n=1 Tax=Agromyces seonyuensis TaxID=2662446 RepID=A0A6I4NSE1_9MICO|nr:alpha/beta hydrolase [Agromyces seonyuensis]MWB97408.1 alpha/beta fold hydrolase [Agromyces seonyuensis]